MRARQILFVLAVPLAALLTFCGSGCSDKQATVPEDSKPNQLPSVSLDESRTAEPSTSTRPTWDQLPSVSLDESRASGAIYDGNSVAPLPAIDLADHENVLAHLRGKLPGKPDDEIIRVLRGYCDDDKSTAVGMTWFAERLRRADEQRNVVARIRHIGGHIVYEEKFGPEDIPLPRPQPGWLRVLLGDDFFDSIVTVSLEGPAASGVTEADIEQMKKLTCLEYLHLNETRIGDTALEHLKGLSQLRCLSLSSTRVTDSGLKFVKGLSRLEDLFVDGTQITDAGLQHLVGMCQLQELSLRDTKVTDAGVAKLQQALPKCSIDH